MRKKNEDDGIPPRISQEIHDAAGGSALLSGMSVFGAAAVAEVQFQMA